MERRTLFPHQRDAFYYASHVEHPAFFMEMRLGKTLVTIRRTLADFPNLQKALIVAPYGALFSWEDELNKEGITGNDIACLYGDRKKKLKEFEKIRTFYLINNEGWIALPEIANVKWDVVIADESTFLKNPQSKVSQFFARNFRSVKRRFILSGSPTPESDLELFQQLKFLDASILGYSNYWEFRLRCFEETRQYTWEMTTEGRELIQKKVRPKCFYLSRKDANINIPKLYTKRLVKLSSGTQKKYDSISKKFLREFEDGTFDFTLYAPVKWTWLRQLCGGFLDGEFVEDSKVKELLSLVKGELKNQQAIIWCDYIPELLKIKEIFDNNNFISGLVYGDTELDERKRIINWFRNGSCQFLIGQPTCFRFSYNLAFCDTMIYYSSPMSNLTRIQSEDRIIHPTSNRPALYIDLLIEGTVDEDIYESHQKKETRQDLFKRILRRIKK